MSKSTFTILFYARKNQVNRMGKAGIMIRVSVNGESVQFSSKLDIEPQVWDTTNQKMIGTTKAARKFNALLDEIRPSLRNRYREIEKYEAYVTAEKVRNAFLGITVRQQTLLGTFRKHNEDVQKLVGISKSAATYRKYDRCFRRVEEFIQTKYRVKDVALKEVTHSFLVSFEQFLRVDKACNQNTSAKFLQTLRMIIIEAKNNGWVFNDPFANYRIRLKKVDRGYLTEEELQRILQKKMPCTRLEQVRDVFIFSLYTGLAYIDVRNLTKENIRTSLVSAANSVAPRHAPLLSPANPAAPDRAAGASKTVTSIMEFEASYKKGRRQILLWQKPDRCLRSRRFATVGRSLRSARKRSDSAVAGLRCRRLRPARLKSRKPAHTPPPSDRKNKPQPAERHSYSSSSKCHNLIRPRAAAARRRKTLRPISMTIRLL
ncbi:site-specific integrase [uncultured Alistipes sp.]|uniref:site-specific integrase n=1 Tax=uncultured Alistipes sp. TaxID=538949 RepID=UPI00266C2A7E|nr:site-specific integrase [uncultured Alistipes sp.]